MNFWLPIIIAAMAIFSTGFVITHLVERIYDQEFGDD